MKTKNEELLAALAACKEMLDEPKVAEAITQHLAKTWVAKIDGAITDINAGKRMTSKEERDVLSLYEPLLGLSLRLKPGSLRQMAVHAMATTALALGQDLGRLEHSIDAQLFAQETLLKAWVDEQPRATNYIFTLGGPSDGKSSLLDRPIFPRESAGGRPLRG